jgi:hypothetical protein
MVTSWQHGHITWLDYVSFYICAMSFTWHVSWGTWSTLHVQNMELKNAHAKCGPFTTLTMNYDFLHTSIVKVTKNEFIMWCINEKNNFRILMKLFELLLGQQWLLFKFCSHECFRKANLILLFVFLSLPFK